MSPWLLAGIWAASGLGGALLVSRLGRRRRLVAAAPLLAAVCAAVSASTTSWPGPLGGTLEASQLSLGRVGVGALVAGGVAAAAGILLAPSLDGGELLAIGAVGAASVLVLGATSPLLWALGAGVAVAAISVRWIAAAPGRPTLASGRVAGAGVALLIAAAVLTPALRASTVAGASAVLEVGSSPSAIVVIVGALLAVGTGALLGLLPVGGWVAGATTAVRGLELVPWALLLAPAMLLTAWPLLLRLPPAARAIEGDALVIGGLASALFGGLCALRSQRGRYPRLLVADLAFSVAGVGTLHATGRLGGLLIVLTHTVCAPLLLHPPREGLGRPRRLAWVSLTGLPPAPAFWGRLLVLEGLADFTIPSLGVGLLAAAVLLGAAVRALVAREPAARSQVASMPVRGLAWGVGLAALALGFAPGAIAGQVFGLSFG